MDKYDNLGEEIFSVHIFSNYMVVYLLYKKLHIFNVIHFNEFGHISTPTTHFSKKFPPVLVR